MSSLIVKMKFYTHKCSVVFTVINGSKCTDLKNSLDLQLQLYTLTKPSKSFNKIPFALGSGTSGDEVGGVVRRVRSTRG